VTLLIYSNTEPVYADTLDPLVVTQQQQAQTIQTSITLIQDEAIQQAQSIQSSLSLLQNAVDKDNAAILEHQKKLMDLDIQQKLLVIQQQKDAKVLGDYVCMEYQQSNSPYLNYLECFVNSKNFGDLLDRTIYVGSIIDYYQTLKIKVVNNAKELELKQQTAQAETMQLTQMAQSKQQIEEVLTASLAKQEEFINSLSDADRLTLANQDPNQRNIDDTARLIAAQTRIAELAAGINGQQAQIAQVIADNEIGKFTLPVKSNGQFRELFAYATTFLGLPYVFGGNSPVTGFDCSSYVQYVYAHFGVSLNRVTWNQYAEGIGVLPADLQPGDLVFFTTYAPGPSHVGIYIGNRMMIDDSDYGVGFDSLDQPYWAARYFGARRVAVQ